jgi:branched-chain amino acid transport system permease protein
LSSDAFFQSILNGLVSGGIYILVALGLTLVMSIMGIVQLSHGEIYMLGAYIVYYIISGAGLHFFVALPLSVLIVGGFGIFLEKFFFRPFRGQVERALIISIGLILLLQNAVLVISGGNPRAYDSPISGVMQVLGVSISWERLFIVFIGFGLVAMLFLFIKMTKIGQAMLAISQDREGAALQGININHGQLRLDEGYRGNNTGRAGQRVRGGSRRSDSGTYRWGCTRPVDNARRRAHRVWCHYTNTSIQTSGDLGP